MTIAIAASLVIHALLAVYLWTAKFAPHYHSYEADQVTQVTLLAPPPPPPPPKVEKPPPKPPPRHKSPPVVHPRPPKMTPMLSEIPPLPIAPTVAKPVPAAPPVIAPPTAAPAPAPEPPKPPVITQPTWRRLPSAEDMARYYPDRALRLGVVGEATLNCAVTASGAVEGCHVAHESPRGEGFGAAALKMSSLFAIRPMTRDGQPVEGARVNIPLRFQLPT